MANRFGIQFNLPKPTHTAPDLKSKILIDLFERLSHITVWDAISDLPSVAHGEGIEITHMRLIPKMNSKSL